MFVRGNGAVLCFAFHQRVDGSVKPCIVYGLFRVTGHLLGEREEDMRGRRPVACELFVFCFALRSTPSPPNSRDGEQ